MEDLQKEFVPHELALRLKALGFDKPCFTFHSSKGVLQTGILDILRGFIPEDLNKGILAPTFSQAFRWFREKYQLFASIVFVSKEYFYEIRRNGEQFIYMPESYKKYEEAELACLLTLIEIVEQQNKEV